MADPERTMLVLFGSETGNAQDMAEDLGRICQRLHFKTRVEELDAIELSTLLQFQLVIFVVSTTGQGDMPHNSLLFWKKLLRKRLAPSCLSRLQYTCFGLGDSTYIKFNWAARKLVRRLEQLGARTFIEPFEADEQFPDGVDGSFVRWADSLRDHLLQCYPLPMGREPIPDDVMLSPRWSLAPALEKSKEDNANQLLTVPQCSLTKGSTESPSTSNTPPSSLLPIPNGWTAELADNKRMTPESHWQDVRLVTFDIPKRGQGDKLRCVPGDCLTLYPKNFPEDAQRLIELMGWDNIADKPLDLTLCDDDGALPRGLHTPASCTIRDLLLHNIDITAIPRRSFLKSMSYFTTDPYHRERLLEFTMTEYLDEYFDYAPRSRRSIIEVLEEFTSVKFPAERLLDIFPRIRGRDFSIANGGVYLEHPSDSGITRVELLVALVKYRTVLRKPREGLCSRYLANLPAKSVLQVSHKPVQTPIHGLVNSQRPLVAMATGTGIAPVRCLIQERLSHPKPGPMLLFFGNRNREADFFFEEEWKALDGAVAPDGSPVLHTFLAFSRDQREKLYVQDLLRRETKRLEQLISKKTIFAVCGGSTKMADACKRAVFDPLTDEGDEESRKRLLASVTWWQEIW